MNQFTSLRSLNRGNEFLQTMFAMTGFLPVAAIAIFAFDIIPLSVSAKFIVIPAFLVMLSIAVVNEQIRTATIVGWVSGLLAVGLYDLSRIPFMIAGWADFIPKIGNWLLETDSAPAIVGYLWRYIGNGGGMGIAFVMLVCLFRPKMSLVKAGTIYGFLIFCCLYTTLMLSPTGEEMMFEIKLLSFTGSLVGHLVYGFVLGSAVKWFAKRLNKSSV